MQVARAAVIAQAFPKLEYFLFFRRGQRRNRGESGEEPPEVRHDGGDLGLLEHDLANPNGVGVAPGPPRQVPRPGAEPAPQPLPHDTAQGGGR